MIATLDLFQTPLVYVRQRQFTEGIGMTILKSFAGIVFSCCFGLVAIKALGFSVEGWTVLFVGGVCIGILGTA